jgi:polyhydroxyalkanoate synthesis regulator phasin
MIVNINLDKAKEIKKDMLRFKRKPLLAELDVEFQRSLENNTDTTDIVSKKQELRDITNPVDGLTSVQELKDYNPTLLEK